jgi:hypothetical protein
MSTILKSKVNIWKVLVIGGVGYNVFVDRGELNVYTSDSLCTTAAI